MRELTMKNTKKNSPLLVCVQKGNMPKHIYEKHVNEIKAALQDIFPKRKIFIHSEYVTISVAP